MTLIPAPIGIDGEFGFLFKGQHSHEDCVIALANDPAFECDFDSIEERRDYIRKRFAYNPGWYRWNIAAGGSDFKRWLEEGTPGKPGSFMAVYLENAR